MASNTVASSFLTVQFTANGSGGVFATVNSLLSGADQALIPSGDNQVLSIALYPTAALDVRSSLTSTGTYTIPAATLQEIPVRSADAKVFVRANGAGSTTVTAFLFIANPQE